MEGFKKDQREGRARLNRAGIWQVPVKVQEKSRRDGGAGGW